MSTTPLGSNIPINCLYISSLSSPAGCQKQCLTTLYNILYDSFMSIISQDCRINLSRSITFIKKFLLMEFIPIYRAYFGMTSSTVDYKSIGELKSTEIRLLIHVLGFQAILSNLSRLASILVLIFWHEDDINDVNDTI